MNVDPLTYSPTIPRATPVHQPRGWRDFSRHDITQYWLAWISQAIGFVAMSSFHLVFPRLVGPSLYGDFIAAFSASFAAFALVGPGYALAVIGRAKGRPISPDDRLRQGVVLAFLLMIMGLPAAYLGAASASGPLNYWLLLGCWLLVPILGLNHLLDCLMISHDRNAESLAARVVVAVVVAIGPIVAVQFAHSAATVLGVVIVAYSAAITLFYRRLLPPLGTWPRAISLTAIPTALLGESLMFSMITSAGTLFASVSILEVAAFTQADIVGNMKLAWTIGTALTALLPFPQILLFARFHRAAHNNEVARGEDRQFRRLLGIILALSMLASAVVAMVGPLAVAHLYGQRFAVAASALHWLAFLLIFQALEQPIIGRLSARLSTTILAPHYGLGFLAGLGLTALIAARSPTMIPFALLVGRGLTTLLPFSTIYLKNPRRGLRPQAKLNHTIAPVEQGVVSRNETDAED